MKPKHLTNRHTPTAKIGGVNLYNFDADTMVHFDNDNVFVDISDKFDHPEYNADNHGHYIRIGSILSEDKSNAKLAKSAANTEAKTLIYYGAPAGSSGVTNTCSHATVECSALCLNTSGNGRYDSIQLSRIAKTRFQTYLPGTFYELMRQEIDYHLTKLDGKEFLAIRPNGTSDQWNHYLDSIVDDYSQVRFYDYTAVPSRLQKTRDNYHVTLSRKETRSNHNWLRTYYGRHNISAVVTKAVKAELLEAGQICGINVVDFDTHDLRLPELDGNNIIGLLSPKGKARGKESGFIVSSVKQLISEIKG